MTIDQPAVQHRGHILRRSVVLGLAAALVLSSSAIAASDDQAPLDRVEIEPQPTRISARIAESFDNDPEAIFRFVADDVRYEPYSGVLRGAAGTYYSRAGNSPDQALLLARLLDAASIPTRFATGSIDDATADALLASGIEDAASVRERLAQAIFGRLPGDAEAVPALPTTVEYVPAYADEQADLVDAWTSAQLIGTMETIGSALDDAGVTVASGFTVVPADEQAQHTWIQASIDDEWIDLDPSMPGIAFGDRLTDASATMTTLPEERWHRVEVGVIAERLEDGVLVTEELMTLDGTAEEFAGRPIIITNVGAESVPALASAFEGVLGLESVHPVIVVGTSDAAGAAMLLKQPAEAGGGLGGGFFGGGDGADETTAQWVELRIMSPGREPTVTRRTVFDRLGADARAAGNVDAAELPPIAAFDLDGDGEFDLAPKHWISWLSVSTGVPSMRAEVVGQADDAPGRVGIVPFSHQVLFQLGVAQDAVALGVRPFIDAPNVTALTTSVVEGPGGDPLAEAVIDIWNRSSGAAEVADVEALVNPAMLPGVLAYISEQLMTGAADADRPRSGASLDAIFEAAADQGVPLTVVSEPRQAAGVTSSAESQQRLLGALDRGWVAVAPERPVLVGADERTGWWLVHPGSGRVVDELDGGRGQSTLERVIVGGVGVLLAGLLVEHLVALTLEFVQAQGWRLVNNKLESELKF